MYIICKSLYNTNHLLINYQPTATDLHIECNFLHDINPFGKCFGHLLHAVEVLHRLLDISVLLQQLKLTYRKGWRESDRIAWLHVTFVYVTG